jgi:hypothetical protein
MQSGCWTSEQQVPPLHSPGFPVELGGVGELHAPFSTERRTRGLVQCCVAGNRVRSGQDDNSVAECGLPRTNHRLKITWNRHRGIMGRPSQGDEKTLLSGNHSPWKRRAPLCHPERTRISCHAAQDRATCAPFSKERRMKLVKATKFNRKSGEAEGSAVPRTIPGNVFDRARSVFDLRFSS